MPADPGRFVGGFNVHANGIRQHVLRYGGAGRALLLLPGITSPAITWGFVAERLARDSDVYVVDYRGRGLSAVQPPWDIDTIAGDAAALIDALGLDRPDILGHSMGARVAIRLARRFPDLVGRLVLVDPPVTGPGRRPYPAPLDWYVDSIRLMVRGGSGAELRRFSPTWTDEQLALRAEWLHTCDEQAIVASYNDFHDSDVHADLPLLRTPALLMRAGRGDVIRDEDVTEIQSLLPTVTVRVVENAGHMIPWDDFEGFFAALGDWLVAGNGYATPRG